MCPTVQQYSNEDAFILFKEKADERDGRPLTLKGKLLVSGSVKLRETVWRQHGCESKGQSVCVLKKKHHSDLVFVRPAVTSHVISQLGPLNLGSPKVPYI